MKDIFLLLGLLLIGSTSFSQNKTDPIEVTPEISKIINADINKQAGQLKAKLTANKEDPMIMEFTLDTFQIEKYHDIYIDYDWSTAGMRAATYDAAAKYDSLLNKYYKKLLAVLKQADKTILVSAQKSWIAFRDNELKLNGVIGKDEYSGGGTMQQLIDADNYLDLVKQRTIQIYQHYIRATQTY